jgi:large subunit ribosomal protein L15
MTESNFGEPLNLEVLQSLIQSSNKVSIGVADLVEAGLISKSDKVKLLGGGEISSKVEVSVHATSKSALEAVERSGGKVVIL